MLPPETAEKEVGGDCQNGRATRLHESDSFVSMRVPFDDPEYDSPAVGSDNVWVMEKY